MLQMPIVLVHDKEKKRILFLSSERKLVQVFISSSLFGKDMHSSMMRPEKGHLVVGMAGLGNCMQKTWLGLGISIRASLVNTQGHTFWKLDKGPRS